MYLYRIHKSILLSSVIFLFVRCTSLPIDFVIDDIKSDIPENIGVQNAIKKAAQMKNVVWNTTAEGMPFNNGSFISNATYSGIPYSSVLEYNQHVFLDVSIETFITATHNPRSVLYTENVSASNSQSSLGRLYHGNICACYYGSTCSYLIVYALGLPFGIAATEFPKWEQMELVTDQSSNGVKLADVIYTPGHVALVTDIKRTHNNVVSSITITENAYITTSSREFTNDKFEEYLSSGAIIMRYKNIKDNTTYTPLPEFVTVDNELPKQYSFNDDICPNYGNKSNYIEGDPVILNLGKDYQSKGYLFLDVYKNNHFINRIKINNIDILLEGLSFGDYKVCLTDGDSLRSQYAFFKVVNMSVNIISTGDKDVVLFSSENALPIYYDFCNESGNKGPLGVNGILSHLLTQTEIQEGKAELTSPLIFTENHPYIKVHFETDYGRTVKSARKNY